MVDIDFLTFPKTFKKTELFLIIIVVHFLFVKTKITKMEDYENQYSNFESDRFPKKIELYLDDGIWTFNKTAIFLNEMSCLYLAHNSFKTKDDESIKCYTFHYKIPNFHTNEEDYDLFIVIKNSINDVADLRQEGLKGFLRLVIHPIQMPKRLQVYITKEAQYYVKQGVFSLPQAKSFIDKYRSIIHGYVLDTTWNVLPLYVTSIMNVCFLNSSLPIGFSFNSGKAEAKQAYQLLLDCVQQQFLINFENQILLSDQGSALKGLYIDNKINLLTCLRHFLVGLKKIKYSYEVCQIIRCKT